MDKRKLAAKIIVWVLIISFAVKCSDWRERTNKHAV